MALDFTALNRIAYRGFDTVEEQEQKDALIDQGFTIVDNAENPFLQAAEKGSEPLPSSTSTAPKRSSDRKAEALARASDGSDYKKLYRVAHDYHQRHNPPIVDREYWQTHTLGVDDSPPAELEYWDEAARDIAETASAYGNDPFLTGLLTAVYGELEREFISIRDNVQKQASEAV